MQSKNLQLMPLKATLVLTPIQISKSEQNHLKKYRQDKESSSLLLKYGCVVYGSARSSRSELSDVTVGMAADSSLLAEVSGVATTVGVVSRVTAIRRSAS